MDRRNLKKYSVATLCYGLAGALSLANVFHKPRSEDYGGLALMIVSFVLVPLWLFSGSIALMGAARFAFWLAVSPILLAVIAVVLVNLFG